MSLQKLSFLVPALLGMLIYANTYEHGYVLDDEDAIVKNRFVQQGIDGLSNIWTSEYRAGFSTEKGSLYRPLTLSIFAIQVEFWPGNSGAAHIFSVILYGLCCMMLFLWLSLLFKQHDFWLPLIIASLYAVHPIHTEVVANIKSLDEIMSALFGFMALFAAVKWSDDKKWTWLLLSAVAMFLAMTSKEGAISLIAVALLMLMLFRSHSTKEALLPSVVMIASSALYLFLRANAIDGLIGGEEIPVLDNMLVSLDGAERFATSIALFGKYILKLIAPLQLSHDYSISQISAVGLLSPAFWLSLILLIGMLLGILKWHKRYLVLVFGLAFFLLTFLLYSNWIITIGTHFGERLMFLPSLGICIAVGWIIWKWGKGKREAFDHQNASLPLAAFGMIVIVLASNTMGRAGQWKDELTLYQADVEHAPNSTRTNYRLGRTYNKMAMAETDANKQSELFEKAVLLFEQSIEIYPEFTDALGELGLAHQNLKEYEVARSYNQRALDINPNHVSTLNNMGALSFLDGDVDTAIPYFEKTLELDPNFRDAASNLGSCYGAIGEYEKAISWFKTAIKIDPDHAQSYFFIALSYQNLGDQNEAEMWLAKARKMDPSIGN